MANQDFLIFKMKNGAKPASWKLGYKDLLLTKFDPTTKRNLGKKRVQYVAGESSIYKEDHTDDKRPSPIYFEYGICKVHKDDFAKIELLKRHPHFDVVYELVDANADAKKELEQIGSIEKALDRVNGIVQDEEKQAVSLVMFGQQAKTWSVEQAFAKLKKEAINKPDNIINKLNSSSQNYQAKFISSLALLKGVVRENSIGTAVVWDNNSKEIVSIARGQNGLTQLSAFLAENNETARVTLQELGHRLKRSYVRKVEVNGAEEISSLLGNDKKDVSSPSETETTSGTEKNDVEEVDFETLEISEFNLEDVDLEDAQKLYEKAIGKVPNNKKNDLDWIKEKLLEAGATN